MAETNKNELKKFKEEARKAAYESENPKYEVTEKDGSTTLAYESGDWKFHDNYFGGDPYGGRTVYFYKGKPIQMMVYYGQVGKEYDADKVYGFLRKALRAPNKGEFRGPKEFNEGVYKYTNNWEGNEDKFKGEENIYKNNKLIYSAIYAGGLVDQREGD
ncbi:MAG: DUF5680 domain-containing protein [bacterium]|nr:DUF5680 domain-containing protein [bacterium]